MNFVVFAQDSSGSPFFSILFLGAMIGVFYFLIIRPQRRRSRAQRNLSESLQVGAEIRTIGGVHGSIVSLDDDSVVLRIEEGRIRVSRRAIASREGDDA